jgi:hypothetical protein
MEGMEVRVISVQHVPSVDSLLRIRQITRVTITVGGYGPFTKDFVPPDDTVDNINAWKLSKAQDVHNIAGVS